MSKITLLALIGLLCAAGANAAGWTVSPIDSSASFTKAQAAIDAAAEGDTIYLDGGISETATLAKRLVLIGQRSTTAPRREGTGLRVFLVSGASGSKIFSMAYLDASFDKPNISGVEIAYCGGGSITGDNVIGLEFHHNSFVSSNASMRLTGSGNVLSNSFVQGNWSLSGSSVVRHVTSLGSISGNGIVIDSSVVSGGSGDCYNCHFQSSMLGDPTFQTWNSYQDLVVDSAWIRGPASGRYEASPIGFTGGAHPLILDSEGYHIPQSPFPYLHQVNLERSKVVKTDSIRAWIRATRPSNGRK